MAGDAQAHACSTNSAEPCAAVPGVDDAQNESGCSRAPPSSVAKELAQLPEVEAIAAKARGLGHDLNNLLAIITTYTLLVLEDLEPDDPSRPDLEQVCEAAERARGVARYLSVLGHPCRSLTLPI